MPAPVPPPPHKQQALGPTGSSQIWVGVHGGQNHLGHIALGRSSGRVMLSFSYHRATVVLSWELQLSWQPRSPVMCPPSRLGSIHSSSVAWFSVLVSTHSAAKYKVRDPELSKIFNSVYINTYLVLERNPTKFILLATPQAKLSFSSEYPSLWVKTL